MCRRDGDLRRLEAARVPAIKKRNDFAMRIERFPGQTDEERLIACG